MYTVPKDIRDEMRKQAGAVWDTIAADGRRIWVKMDPAARPGAALLAQQALWKLTHNPLLAPPGIHEGSPIAYEAQRLRAMAAKNIPVPEVLHAEDDYMTLADAGRTLVDVLHAQPARAPELSAMAARALRALHDAGDAHGGAQIKNIALDGGQIRFLDFETVIPAGLLPEFQTRDVFLLALSLQRHGHDPDLAALCSAYDPAGTTHMLSRVCQGLCGLRLVRVMEHPWLGGLSMRDIRSLAALVAKAQQMCTE